MVALNSETVSSAACVNIFASEKSAFFSASFIACVAASSDEETLSVSQMGQVQGSAKIGNALEKRIDWMTSCRLASRYALAWMYVLGELRSNLMFSMNLK